MRHLRSSRTFPALLVAGLVLGCASGRGTAEAGAPPVAAPSLQSTIAGVRRFILDTMRVLRAPGAAISVRKDGRLVWSEGFGSANLEQHVPVTPLTTRNAMC